MKPQDSARRYAAVAHAAHTPSALPTAGTVVMLHGLGGDTTQFDSILHYLRCPAYHVVRIDMRAHGATQLIGSESDFTFRQFALDVAALLDQRAYATPLIGVGVSMGAGVLASIAVAGPSRFSRLFLVRPAWEHLPNPDHLRPFQEVAALLGSRGSSEGKRLFRSSNTFRQLQGQSPYAAETLLREFAAPQAAARRVRLERMPACTPFDSLADLRKITIPVTVVGTQRDPLHPMAIARHWAEYLPQARCELVPPKSSQDERYAQRLGQLVTESLAPCELSAPGH